MGGKNGGKANPFDGGSKRIERTVRQTTGDAGQTVLCGLDVRPTDVGGQPRRAPMECVVPQTADQRFDLRLGQGTIIHRARHGERHVQHRIAEGIFGDALSRGFGSHEQVMHKRFGGRHARLAFLDVLATMHDQRHPELPFAS